MIGKKMDPEVKAKWVEALRSGEYKQGKGGLHYVISSYEQFDRFCCLGVLCEVAIKEGLAVEVSLQNDQVFYNGHTGFPDDQVVEWAGLPDRYGTLPYLENTADLPGSVADANDTGYTFEYIADLIEEHL